MHGSRRRSRTGRRGSRRRASTPTTSRVHRRVEPWDEWLRLGKDGRRARGARPRKPRRSGDGCRAGEAWVRAALSYHFAKFVWLVDLERNREAARLAIDALYAAHRQLDPLPSASRCRGRGNPGRQPARPARRRARPVAPGLDSTKEEFFHWEDVFLRRGMATLSSTAPVRARPASDAHPGDYEVAVSAISTRSTASPGPGQSARSASRSAATTRRAPPPLSRGPRGRRDQRAVRLRRVLGWAAGADARDVPPPLGRRGRRRGARKAHGLSLDGVLGGLEQPMLLVTGKLDRLIPWEQTERSRARPRTPSWSSTRTATTFATTCPTAIGPLVADWLAETLCRAG